MKTFTLTDLNKVLSTAKFVIQPEFISSLSKSDFADLEIIDENVEAKFYPKLISAQKIEISGIPLTVTKTIEIAVFVTLDKEDKLSSYIDEEHFYSLANHEVTFEGDNIAITSEDAEILTLPSDTANKFIFNDSIHDYDVSLNLPELSIDEASDILEELLSNSTIASSIKKNLA